MNHSNEGVIIDARRGDDLALSKYLSSPVTVKDTVLTPQGRCLLVESTGGTTYRLRAVEGDDDRLLMEKKDGDGWTSFIRLDAAPAPEP